MLAVMVLLLTHRRVGLMTLPLTRVPMALLNWWTPCTAAQRLMVRRAANGASTTRGSLHAFRPALRRTRVVCGFALIRVGFRVGTAVVRLLFVRLAR